ncbi:hypothetical protein [Halarcobacter bivalviorum]|uniref:Membrane protein n=1 Tax=Halarcobacter bivalviorum TaxID=663364 RepID=A0AAX2A856_9BACT|nr:hypothetical protein [Halarcobacter bivalviorum]AXH13255.1 putative membrane protein [Halarcobacter bivalviorum]RXK10140.1 hypothetical protein CRV05_07100 [Halarcobacter bivalviorum]
MKKILVLVLVFFSIVFANDFTKEESSVFNGNTNTAPSNNTNVFLQDNDLTVGAQTPPVVSKNLYLSYINYPKHIYKNQRFEIDIKALITRTNYDRIETHFIDGVNMLPLNAQNSWSLTANSKNVYTNKYYFKAYDSNFLLPTIEVRLYDNNVLIESRKLFSPKITFSEVAKGDELFSNVIAKDLTLLNTKAKQYTNKEALAIIDLEANYSNFEDFYIKGFEEQGVTLIEDNYPNQHMIYYVVIPIHQKVISFNYFNTTKNRLEKITIPIKFEEELVSTQTDLNPNNSSFEFYKKVAIGVVALVFLVLFIWKRSYLYLILFLIMAIAFMLFAMPNTTVKLKENSVIYILPTKNSTIFQKMTDTVTVEEMKRKNGFVKIMFKRGEEKYIGWVKEQDVIKN